MPIIQWTPLELHQALQENPDLILVDVREDNEYAYAHIQNSLHIPLRQLPERQSQLNSAQPIAIICHHGMRSMLAWQFLQHQGYSQLFNIQGGIDAWSLACDSSVPRY